MHDGAHRGVVGGSDVPPKREGTRSGAVVSVVTTGGDDPAGPADLLKINKKRNPLAGRRVVVEPNIWRCTAGPAAAVVGVGLALLGLFCRNRKEGLGYLNTIIYCIFPY